MRRPATPDHRDKPFTAGRYQALRLRKMLALKKELE